MNFYPIKVFVKRLSLSLGLYRPARFLNDLITRRSRRGILEQDIKLYSDLLPNGVLCFDVGANIGEKTDAMLRSGMRVLAIEPQPTCVAELNARCGKDPNLTIVQTAIGAEVGDAELFISDAYHASSSLKVGWTSSSSSITVPVTTLDVLIERYGLPHYCKIDVEGFEMEVLKGLTNPIPLISLEYHLNEAEIKKASDCIGYISKLANGDIRLNLTPAEVNVFEFNDWLTEQEFWSKFPDTIIERQGFKYGDIWVKSCI
ncbi:MAG: FkbM family methyltransferase [Pyrinomonadaceae bacterium]